MTNLKLYDFTTITSDDGDKILQVRARISDHRDHEKQKEWIDFQFSIDVPTVRNGAKLRIEALEQARDQLDLLAKHFRQNVDQNP